MMVAEALVGVPHVTPPVVLDGHNPVLKTVLNFVLGEALSVYYLSRDGRNGRVTDSLTDDGTSRDILFFRGMLRFRPGREFIQGLAAGGFHFHVYQSPHRKVEADLFHSWHLDTAQMLTDAVLGHVEIDPSTIYMGHSAGVGIVMTLSALAKGVAPQRIREALTPHLREVRDDALAALAARLPRNGAYYGIASPIAGIPLKALAARLNGWILDGWFQKGLVTELTYEGLEAFYGALGMRPEELLDGIVVSRAGLLSIARWNPAAAAARAALAVFPPLCMKEAGPTDLIVPTRTAFFDGVPAVCLLGHDHLDAVETRVGAEAVLSLVVPTA